MLTIFRQALIEHARFLPLVDATSAEENLPLFELYIERTPVLRGEDPSTLNPSEKRSLSDLIREPSARVIPVGEPCGGTTTCVFQLALDYANSESATDQESMVVAPRPLPLLFHPRSGSSTPEWIEPLLLSDYPDLPFTFLPPIE